MSQFARDSSETKILSKRRVMILSILSSDLEHSNGARIARGVVILYRRPCHEIIFSRFCAHAYTHTRKLTHVPVSGFGKITTSVASIRNVRHHS